MKTLRTLLTGLLFTLATGSIYAQQYVLLVSTEGVKTYTDEQADSITVITEKEIKMEPRYKGILTHNNKNYDKGDFINPVYFDSDPHEAVIYQAEGRSNYYCIKPYADSEDGFFFYTLLDTYWTDGEKREGLMMGQQSQTIVGTLDGNPVTAELTRYDTRFFTPQDGVIEFTVIWGDLAPRGYSRERFVITETY